MDTLVFSDTHLTPEFDPKLHTALRTVISAADNVIINGDFWDGYLTDFDSFVHSPWKELFPLLKSKRSVYIYGNHDAEWMANKQTRLFSSIQVHAHHHVQGPHSYVIKHGHNLYPSIVTKYSELFPVPIVRRLNQWLTKQEKRQSTIGWVASQLETYFDGLGESLILEHRKKELITSDSWLVLGHTHRARYLPKKRYLNSGRFSGVRPSYIIINDEGCQLKFFG